MHELFDSLSTVTATSASTGRPRRIRGLDAEQRRAQRKDLLLDAALELFTTRGYTNTSIELICQTAYVSTKSFYALFDNREDCFVALYERTTQHYRDHMGATLGQSPEGEQTAVRYLLRTYVDMLADDPRKAQVTFGDARLASPTIERARRDNRRWAAEFLELIWQRYGTDGDHHRIAIAVIGGIFDVIADWLHDSDPADITTRHTLVDDLIDFYTAVRQGLATITPS